MAHARALVTRFPLWTFFVLSCALTWTGLLTEETLAVEGYAVALAVLPALILLPGPLYASIVVTWLSEGRAGLERLLGKLVQWRVGWKWFAVAMIMAPTLSIAPAYLNMLFGAPNPTLSILAAWPVIAMTFALRLVNPLAEPIQQELGWRGFALPIIRMRHSALVASALLGLFVAFWSIPLVWLGHLHIYSLVQIVATTILFGWFSGHVKGSVLLTTIAHAADGLFLPDLLALNNDDSIRHMALLVAVWSAAALAIIAIYGPTLASKGSLLVAHPAVARPL